MQLHSVNVRVKNKVKKCKNNMMILYFNKIESLFDQVEKSKKLLYCFTKTQEKLLG